MLCGTEPFPELFRAKKYKLYDNYINKKDFHHIMKNLPIPVSEEDIDEMFTYADNDKDGKISYKEFQTMINPPKPPQPPKPSIKDLCVVPVSAASNGTLLKAGTLPPPTLPHPVTSGLAVSVATSTCTATAVTTVSTGTTATAATTVPAATATTATSAAPTTIVTTSAAAVVTAAQTVPTASK